jgi:hypothetical protein
VNASEAIPEHRLEQSAHADEAQLNAEPGPDPIEFAGLNEPRGLRTSRQDNLPGYVMFNPMISDTTYLVNREGQVVHVWKNQHAPSSEYLLEDGHLLRGARLPDVPRFSGGGQGGRIEKVNFEGEVVWSFDLADKTNLLHHDFAPMPNGNILAIAWEAVPKEQAIALGRDPELTPEAGIWPDLVIEIEPTAEGGRIVWEWHVWDHLVQNRDPAKPDYGELSDFPRRVDINGGPPLPPAVTADELQMAKSRNEAPGGATILDRGSDLFHSNGIDYNAELDQIALSVRAYNEIWVIDHSISSEQAAGPAGDLLYRWGSPDVYGHEAGVAGLGHQHDIRWIPGGHPGAGNLMAFSNDGYGVTPPFSQVIEFAPPLSADGSYSIAAGEPFGPAESVWTYSDGNFYSPFISGAQRMSNGNTLVTFGPQGRFVEVDTTGEIVWEYWSPYSGEVRMPDGTFPQPGAPFMYATFRSTFIPVEHPAIKGRTLAPLDPQPPASVLREEELAPFRQPEKSTEPGQTADPVAD